MEQWQFLIQKQGERAWQPLESAYAEIVEGRYRIVASTENVNTDVEVRVVHQSPSETPPRRRIHKRLRRTNSEGLTAVIPFTYFAPGVWEVRCSGDLMSDMFGTSWQHNLRLQVLPLIAKTEITPGNHTESDSVSNLPIPPAPPNFLTEVTIGDLNLGDIAFEEESITQELEISVSSHHNVDETAPVIENVSTESISTTNVSTETIEPNVNTDNVTETDNEASLIASSENQLLDDSVNSIDNTHNTDNTYPTETTYNTDVIIDEPINLSINSLTLSIHNSVGEAIVDQPVNPVWVRGDTAEQILHNLIELALPNNESLLEEEASSSSQLEQPLPLLLCLDEQSYVTQWGRSLAIHGRIKLRDGNSPHQDDTSDFESVGAGELRVELRSPLGLEVLVKQQQSVGERLLPFGFEFSVEIPASCESKLILADIYFYGALSSVGDSILLASQSFTVTADVSELLAVSTTAKPSEPDMLDVAQPQLTPEPEKSVSINLELFNLAKTARGQVAPLVTQPSPKRALPLRVDAYKTKLPQIETSQLSDSESYSTLVDNVTGSNFPFLRKRQVQELLEPENIEPENIELETIKLETIKLENIEFESVNNQTYTSEVEDKVTETTNHLITDNAAVSNQLHNYSQQNSEPLRTSTFPYDTEIVNHKPFVSPLIKKWMQSQGYSTSETINLDYQNYSAVMAPQNVPQMAPQNVPQNVPTISTDNSTENQSEEDESINIEQKPLEDTEEVQQISEVTEEIKTPSTWIAQEIVVDDIDEGVDNSLDNTESKLEETLVPEASVADMLSSLPFKLEDIEILPVPQINLPAKELISGNTIRLRILLKEMRPNTGIKLWVEDCQTRWLLEGPHLLTDLLPNSFESGMELITELNIPFGCVEIRIEAVSVDIVTQLESDKVSIQRTVVPPDLPVMQFDELLGI